MSNKKNEIKKSVFFENLFTELENRDDYHVTGMKIEIAEQIYLLMKKKKVNKAELARKLGKNRAYVTRILKGDTNFTIETIVKIGRRLDAEWQFNLVEKGAKKGRDSAETVWRDREPARVFLMEDKIGYFGKKKSDEGEFGLLMAEGL